jgi:hypothetical protein
MLLWLAIVQSLRDPLFFIFDDQESEAVVSILSWISACL